MKLIKKLAKETSLLMGIASLVSEGNDIINTKYGNKRLCFCCGQYYVPGENSHKFMCYECASLLKEKK